MCAWWRARRAGAKRSKSASNSRRRNGDRDVAVDTECDRVGLVPADQQAGPVGLVVDEVIGVAHRRHAAELDRRVAVDRSAQQVLVLDRHRRHPDAGHATDLHAPHPGGVDEQLALDRVARRGVDGGAAPAVDGDRRDLGVLADLRRRACAPRGRSPASPRPGRCSRRSGRNAAASTSVVLISGNSACACSALTMSIGSPNDLAIVVNRRSSIVRSGEHDSRRLPVSCQSTAWPVSASSPRYISTDCSSIRVVLRDDRNWPTRPAACHVAPSVSSCCSRITTSRSPYLVSQ